MLWMTFKGVFIYLSLVAVHLGRRFIVPLLHGTGTRIANVNKS